MKVELAATRFPPLAFPCECGVFLSRDAGLPCDQVAGMRAGLSEVPSTLRLCRFSWDFGRSPLSCRTPVRARPGVDVHAFMVESFRPILLISDLGLSQQYIPMQTQAPKRVRSEEHTSE